MSKIGFIGMGNMGFAMLKGSLNVFDKGDLLFTRRDKVACQRIQAETGIEYTESNRDCAKAVKYVILAIKPQFYKEIIEEIKSEITPDKIIISLAPTVSIEGLKQSFGSQIKIVRAMPNTPAMVGEGMTGYCLSEDSFTEEELNTLTRFFTSFGKGEVIQERLMNAVVAASGSSPAFVYMFIEALADGVVRYGLPRAQAYTFVSQTVLGAAKMVMETGIHPGQLKDQVCSPGGTTIEGVAALEEEGFRKAIIAAARAVVEKCQS